MAFCAVAITPVAQSKPNDTVICDQFGSATTGPHVVQNNGWNTGGAKQCLTAANSGFAITTED